MILDKGYIDMSDKIWESRKKNISLLYRNIKNELNLKAWLISHPSEIDKRITIEEFIKVQKNKLSEYLLREVATDTIKVFENVISKFELVISPRVLEPFRQSLQIFDESDMRIVSLNSEIRRLNEINAALNKKVDDKNRRIEYLHGKLKAAKIDYANIGSSDLTSSGEPVDANKWKEWFISKFVDKKEFRNKQSIIGFVNARKMHIKRSDEDLWRLDILTELRQELLKKHGFE